MNKTKILILIPARLESKRLPRKVMLEIGGKPMLQHVLERCRANAKNIEVLLCTDSEEILNFSSKLGFKSFLTSEKCSSGTARIASIINNLVIDTWLNGEKPLNKKILKDLLKRTLVVNVQADQPFLDSNILNDFINHMEKYKDEKFVLTAIYPLKSAKSIQDPNVVKTIIAKNGSAIYFSRSPIPYLRNKNKEAWHEFYDFWGHSGIYGYRGDVLSEWESIEKSNLEDAECLEQLRLIEAGYTIKTIKLNHPILSVDTQKQLEEARKINQIHL